jgi:hypothetical protein
VIVQVLLNSAAFVICMDCQNLLCGLFKSLVCSIALLIACFRSNQLPDQNGFPSMVVSGPSRVAKIGYDRGFLRNPIPDSGHQETRSAKVSPGFF